MISLLRGKIAQKAEGSLIVDASIRRSVIGRNVRVGEGAEIEESIILDGTVVGPKARLCRVIADRFNLIPAGTVLGYEQPVDNSLRYTVDKAGIIVLPRGHSYGGRAVPPIVSP